MKRTSTEAHVYMRRHQGAKVKHFDVSNVICHKFSHGAVPYTLNGENANVMLEYEVFRVRVVYYSVIRKVTQTVNFVYIDLCRYHLNHFEVFGYIGMVARRMTKFFENGIFSSKKEFSPTRRKFFKS